MLSFPKTFVVILAILAPLAAHADPIQYTITELPPGEEPLAINNSGVIAGQILLGPQTQAFVAQPGGPVVGIGPLPVADGGTFSGSTMATSINSSGQVAGTITDCGVGSCGFIDNNGVFQTFAPQGSSVGATSINDSGVVAGSSSGSTTSTAYTWSNGQFQYLGYLPGDTGSHAYGINNSGQVVGVSFTNLGPTHAFLYSNGTMQDLGTLPGDTDAYAWSINNLGQVTGQSSGGTPGVISAFIYDPGTGQMTALGNLPGSSSPGFQRPEDINDSGEVVGYDDLGSGPDLAFLYSGGSMYNLNDLLLNGNGWVLTGAYGINDSGDIVGEGTYDGVLEGFILNRVTPEPDARFLLLALALVIIGVRQKRVRTSANTAR